MVDASVTGGLCSGIGAGRASGRGKVVRGGWGWKGRSEAVTHHDCSYVSSMAFK